MRKIYCDAYGSENMVNGVAYPGLLVCLFLCKIMRFV